MKTLLFIFLSCIMMHAHAQYAFIKADNFNYQHTQPQFGAEFSIGVKNHDVGFGLGFAAIKMQNAQSLYIPAFAEVIIFSKHKKIIKPIVDLQAGYSLFDSDNTTGGVYYHPSAGIIIRDRITLQVGYVYSQFSTRSLFYEGDFKSSIHGFSLSLGIKL